MEKSSRGAEMRFRPLCGAGHRSDRLTRAWRGCRSTEGSTSFASPPRIIQLVKKTSFSERVLILLRNGWRFPQLYAAVGLGLDLDVSQIGARDGRLFRRLRFNA